MRFKTIILTGLLTFCSAPYVFAQGVLNMVCCSPQPVCDAVVGAFSAQTNINVNMIRMSSGEAYAKIRSEARNPKTDVWFAGTHEPHYQAAGENLTQSHRTPHLENLMPLAQKVANETDNKVNTFGVGILGFVYDPNKLKEKNLPEPTSWADLLNEAYKGEIVLSNPNTAGTGNSILVALVALMGEDAAFDYLKKLSPNVSTYAKSGAVGAQVARGEVSIAVTFLHGNNTLIEQGFPLKMVTPVEGTGYGLDSVSLVKGARNEKEARAFIDWVLEPQPELRNSAGDVMTRGGVMSKYRVDGVEGVKFIDLDHKLYGSPQRRKELLSRWDREIGAIAGIEQ